MSAAIMSTLPARRPGDVGSMPYSRHSHPPPVINPAGEPTPAGRLKLLLGRARQCHGAQDLDGAVATCREILAGYPGRPDEAIGALRRAIAAHPRAAGLQAALGNAQFVANRLDDAVASYRRALAI